MNKILSHTEYLSAKLGLNIILFFLFRENHLLMFEMQLRGLLVAPEMAQYFYNSSTEKQASS